MQAWLGQQAGRALCVLRASCPLRLWCVWGAHWALLQDGMGKLPRWAVEKSLLNC